MRINTLFAVLTFIIIIIVILTADSIITALAVSALLLNILAVSSRWKQLRRKFASLNTVGWGMAPEDDEDAKESSEDAKESASEDDELPPRKLSLIEENRITPVNTVEDQNTNLYGRAQEEYDGYNTAYTDCWRKPKPALFKTCGEQDQSIDAANVMMAQRRARDKRCMDGLVSKDKYYYRHHFAGELDEAEEKVWWSRDEV